MKHLKTLDDARSFESRPDNFSHMIKADVHEDSMGSLVITFDNGKSIFAQSDYDIDAFIDSIVWIEDEQSYSILDEYLDVAETRGE